MADVKVDVEDDESTRSLLRKEIEQIGDVPDPFINPWKPPCWWRCIVQVLCGLVFVPVRITVLLLVVVLIFVPNLLLLSLLSCCCDCNQKKDAPERAHGCFRRAALLPIRFGCRICLWCVGFWWISVTKKRGASKNPRILVANHVSFVDAIFLAYYYSPVFVSKAAIRKIPIIGSGAIGMQTIFVDRADKESRQKTKDAMIHRAKKENGFPAVAIFPEGTCTNGKCMIRFASGAFSLGEAVQPLALRYSSCYLNPAAVGDLDGMGTSLFAMMLQPYNCLHLTILPECSSKETESPITFGNKVRDLIAERLGVRVSDHSYEDLKMHWFSVMRQIPLKQNFEVVRIKELTQLNLDSLKELLQVFTKADANQDGVLDVDEFCGALGLQTPPTKWSKRLFNFFDVEGDGTVSYVEFVKGISLLSTTCTEKDRMKLAFIICDEDADGKINKTELKKLSAIHQQELSDRMATTFVRLAGSEEANATIGFEQFCELAREHKEEVEFMLAEIRPDDPNLRGSGDTPYNPPKKLRMASKYK